MKCYCPLRLSLCSAVQIQLLLHPQQCFVPGSAQGLLSLLHLILHCHTTHRNCSSQTSAVHTEQARTTKISLHSPPWNKGKVWREEMLQLIFQIDYFHTFQSLTPSFINTCRVKILSSGAGAVTWICDSQYKVLSLEGIASSTIFCSFSLLSPSSKICQNRLFPIYFSFFLLFFILFHVLSQPPLSEVFPWGKSCPLYFLLCAHNRTLSA